jgi:stringent starvation protein B
MEMTSTRPYLLRGIYEWILENQCTPYLLVDARREGVRVPPQVVKDGQVVLNLAPRAIDRLDLGIDAVRFNARFSGVSQTVIVPVSAVLAIYAQENGQGMMFPPDEEDAPPAQAEMAGEPNSEAAGDAPIDQETTQAPRPDGSRPKLRIVK